MRYAPQHTQTLYILGVIYLRQRRASEAGELFSKAVEADPGDHRYHAALGDALQRQLRFGEALTSYRRSLLINDAYSTARAKVAATEFALAHLASARPFFLRADLLAYALAQATCPGLVLEFGVAEGKSLAFLAGLAGQTVYGFDSFAGLPENWRSGFEAGAFSQQKAPTGLPENAELVVGLFEDTLPDFRSSHADPIRFMHVDCDLYSSTRTVFRTLGGRLRVGSVIVFDEYMNYEGWADHEFKAFAEFIEISGMSFEYIGYVPGGMQVAVRITGASVELR